MKSLNLKKDIQPFHKAKAICRFGKFDRNSYFQGGVGTGSGAHGGKNSTAGGVGGGAHGPNQLRQGLNPMLRGYSPSKNRWKIATGTGAATGANRQNHGHGSIHHHGSSATGSVGHGAAGGHFGGANPNVYTRSTKHTPAHAGKV